MAECKWYPACPMKYFFEKGKLDKKWVEDYCRGEWRNCVRYHLEEEGRSHPDWMLPNGILDEKLKS